MEKQILGADPYLFIDPASGKAYVYATGGGEVDKTVLLYRSDDLVHYDYLGRALDINYKGWGKNWFWAPEVYYNPKTKLYFMFYSARVKDELLEKYFDDPAYEEGCKIGVAVAKSPEGPFRNISDEPLDWRPYDENAINGYPTKKEEISSKGAYVPLIDASLYFENGRIFLLVSRSCYKNLRYDEKYHKFIEESNICGVEIDDEWWNDPDGKTMPRIKEKYVRYIDGKRKDLVNEILSFEKDPQEWENGNINDAALTHGLKKDRRWEEGPSLVKRDDGQYLLLYSCNNFENPYYGVGGALAPTPLGPYKKLVNNPLISSDPNIPICSTGHGSVAYKEGRFFYMFHGRPSADRERMVYLAPLDIEEDTEVGDVIPCLAA